MTIYLPALTIIFTNPFETPSHRHRSTSAKFLLYTSNSILFLFNSSSYFPTWAISGSIVGEKSYRNIFENRIKNIENEIE